MKKILSICPYCGLGCRFIINVEGDNITGIELYRNEINNGKLCPKGITAIDFINNKNRLNTPLKLVNNKHISISWDIALNEISNKLTNIIKNYGSNAIAFLASARCSNEENYLLQKIARLLGTNNIDHCARLCHSSTIAGLSQTLGAAAQTGTFNDILDTNLLLIWGYNPAETHPVIMNYILKAKYKGTKIIVADPRKTKTTWFADIHLDLNSGTDVYLINTIINLIIKLKLYNEKFIYLKTKNFKQLINSVKSYNLEYAEKITGIPKHIIYKTAITFATAKKAIIMWAMGITQHITGTNNVIALCNLGLLCGYVGKKGCGIFPMRGQNNVQGACDMGTLPNVFPGYLKINDTNAKKLSKLWHSNNISANPGLTIQEIFEAISKKKIKALYVMGENPAVSDPDTSHVIKTLKSLELLVVQDIFLTSTAKLAHYVLPAALYAEKEGSFTSSERRVQWNFKAVEPPGKAKPDWEMLCLLGKKLQLPQMNYNCIEDITIEISNIIPNYKGITPTRLKEKINGLKWPCPHIRHPGTDTLHQIKFATSDGKAHFVPTNFTFPREETTTNFPFTLTTVRIVGQYHTMTMTGKSKSIMKRWKEPFIEINPIDANDLNIKNNDQIKIITKRGSYICKAKITKNVKPKMLALPWHWGANLLTNRLIDPYSKIPAFKINACRIEKV